MTTSTPASLMYNGIHCNIAIEQLTPEVLVLRISGIDVGEFGDVAMQELSGRISSVGPIDLFIDARNVTGASIEVSGDWARWLREHKSQLRAVHMLTGSRFIEVTAEFVRRFAELQGIMRIYTDAAAFDDAVDAAKQ
jgi:hypothetical protein